jgi:hypothetical protein
MISKLYIGKIISEKLTEKDISKKDIAKQLDIPESILSLMLKNDDLGCNVLFKICHILDHDFFRYYSNQLTNPDYFKNGSDKSEKKKVLI